MYTLNTIINMKTNKINSNAHKTGTVTSLLWAWVCVDMVVGVCVDMIVGVCVGMIVGVCVGMIVGVCVGMVVGVGVVQLISFYWSFSGTKTT